MSDNLFGVHPKCQLNSVEDTIVVNLGHSSKI